MTASRNDNICKKERKAQDVGDERNNVRTVIRRYKCGDINEDDFEIDTVLCDELQGVKQEDPVLKDGGKLVAKERPGTSGEEQVDRHSLHKQTVVMTTKEAAILDCGHMVMDSAI